VKARCLRTRLVVEAWVGLRALKQGTWPVEQDFGSGSVSEK
jgi:hypothetical protein